MTHIKTESNQTKSRHTTLTLRRATEPGDAEHFARLCHIHDGPSRYPLMFRRPPRKDDEVLMGFHPDGRPASCMRMNIVTSTEVARDLLGAFVRVQFLPALVMERTCADPDEYTFDPTRMLMLRFAPDIYVNRVQVRTLIEMGLPRPSALSNLERLGYAELLGKDSHGHPLSVLHRDRFEEVAHTLRTQSCYRFFHWRGLLPFAEHLPDHVKNNW